MVYPEYSDSWRSRCRRIPVRRPGNTWYLRSSASSGAPNVGVFQYGAPGWLPVAGDWTGIGRTGIGVFDPGNGNWYIRNTASSGGPDVTPFSYGGPGWRPIAGSWIGVGGSPQLADSFESFAPATTTGITQQQLDATVGAALKRLQQAGVDSTVLSILASAEYRVGDLSGTYLGYTIGHTVSIDRHAAGRGWFVDATPLADEEFDGNGVALAGTAAAGRMDLMTTLLHEMGHVAGRGDGFDGVNDLMYAVLSTGHRRTNALDTVFASGAW